MPNPLGKKISGLAQQTGRLNADTLIEIENTEGKSRSVRLHQMFASVADLATLAGLTNPVDGAVVFVISENDFYGARSGVWGKIADSKANVSLDNAEDESVDLRHLSADLIKSLFYDPIILEDSELILNAAAHAFRTIEIHSNESFNISVPTDAQAVIPIGAIFSLILMKDDINVRVVEGSLILEGRNFGYLLPFRQVFLRKIASNVWTLVGQLSSNLAPDDPGIYVVELLTEDPEGVIVAEPNMFGKSPSGRLWFKASGDGNTGWFEFLTSAGDPVSYEINGGEDI